MSAYAELMEYLKEGEVVEAIVFGAWGWSEHGAPKPSPVPDEVKGKVLTLEQAEPMMQSWNFYGGYGAPECYATHIWTDRRVLWITQYDGLTQLSSAPRNPKVGLPSMPGG